MNWNALSEMNQSDFNLLCELHQFICVCIIRISFIHKCAQAHDDFVVVFKLLVHKRIHTYISDMKTETVKEA